jgi:hypothetical protein
MSHPLLNQNLERISQLPCACYMPNLFSPSRLKALISFDQGDTIWRSSLCNYFQPPITAFSFRTNILLSAMFLNSLSLYFIYVRTDFTLIQKMSQVIGLNNLFLTLHI